MAGCPFEVPDCLYGCFGFAVDGDHVPVLVVYVGQGLIDGF